MALLNMQALNVVALSCIVCVECTEQFKVLRMADIPFPSSSEDAAAFNGSYNTDIPEFTVCYRFLIESYNDGWIWILGSENKETSHWFFQDRIGWDLGQETEGFQSGATHVYRNIPGGGLGNERYPVLHYYSLARNIDISKWYHMCTSYSSILQKVHMY